MTDFVLTAFVGFVAATIGSISGGGGLVSLSYMLFIGLPIDISIATNRLAAFGMFFGAIENFYKSKKIVWKLVPFLSLAALVGGLIGAHFVVSVDKDLLEKVVGILLLLLLPILFISKHFGEKTFKTSKTKKLIGLLAYFMAMVFAGIFGGAAVIILIYILVYFFGLTFLRANATDLIAWMSMVTGSFIFFAIHGLVDYKVGAALFIGALGGGFFGSKLAIEKGNAFVKIILGIVLVLSSIKLLS